MSGCACLGKIFLIPVALFLLGAFVLALLGGWQRAPRRPPAPLWAQVFIKDMGMAIAEFHKAYHRLPLHEPVSAHEDTRLRSSGTWLAELLNDPGSTLNSKRLVFISPVMANGGKNGLLQKDGAWVLVDPWGEPYYLIFDTNNDGMVSHLEFSTTQNISSPPLPQHLRPGSVIIYSAGPDRDPGTWEDNIRNWE